MFDRAKTSRGKPLPILLQICMQPLDLGQKNIQAVLKNKDGKIIKENKIQRNTTRILEFLENSKKDGNIDIVMESGYNYQYLYDFLFM